METNYSETTKVFCWRRLLRVPWTAERSNQAILKEINPEYSMEGLMLKVKLQYFGHVIQTADLLEKTLMLGKTEGRGEGGDGGWDSWMASLAQWTCLSKLWETVKDRHAAILGVTKSWARLNDNHHQGLQNVTRCREHPLIQQQGWTLPLPVVLTKPRPPHLDLYPGCPDRPVNRLRTIGGVNTPRKTSCWKLNYRTGIFSTVNQMVVRTCVFPHHDN